MLTAEQVKAIAPKARDDYTAALVKGADVFAKYHIDTPMRLAQFLAQVCHETGGLVIVREQTGYRASTLLKIWPSHFTSGASTGSKVNADVAAKRGGKWIQNWIYGPDVIGKSLGNTKASDGYDFRGGGFAQTTGRDNYTRIGEAIGVDLADHPELIEDASISLQAACFELAQFVSFMDLGEKGLKAVSNGLNRGNPHSAQNPIGWDERQLWFRKVCRIMGVSATVSTETVRMGESSELVGSYQGRLADLGYAVGRADKSFGPRMRSAVLTFQAENDLSTTGEIDAATSALLNSEAAKPMPLGDRAEEGKADLIAAGSGTVKTADNQQKAGASLTAAGILAGVAHQTGAGSYLPDFKTGMADFGVVKDASTAIMDALQWSTSHWYFGAAVVGYFAYRWGGRIIAQRVDSHQAGLNLSK